MSNPRLLKLNISKIVNRQMYMTISNDGHGTYSVVPFDHSIFLDVGLYSVFKNTAAYTTSGGSQIVCTDKWDNNNSYSYVKISNDTGEEQYTVKPKYEKNRIANLKNGFALVRHTDNAFNIDSYGYLICSAFKVVNSILGHEYFTTTYGQILGDTPKQARGLVKDYMLTQDIIDKIEVLPENDLIIRLCAYSMYFILATFVSEQPEVTTQYRLCEKFLLEFDRNQSKILNDRIRNAYLDFLSIISRDNLIYNNNGKWETSRTTSRKFSYEIEYSCTKFRKVFISNYASSVNKTIDNLEDELNILVGYLQIFTSQFSLEQKNNTMYKSFRKNFIIPSLENSDTYKECARQIIEGDTNDIVSLRNKAEELVTTAEIIENTPSSNVLLKDEAKDIILNLIKVYGRKLKTYISDIANSVSTGAYQVTKADNYYETTAPYDVAGMDIISELSRGFIPFGYSLYEHSVPNLYGANSLETTRVFTSHYVTDNETLFTPVYSPILYSLTNDSIRNSLEKSSRVDRIQGKSRVVEIEFLNRIFVELLSNIYNKAVPYGDKVMHGTLRLDKNLCINAFNKTIQGLILPTINYYNDVGNQIDALVYKTVYNKYISILNAINENDVLIKINTQVEANTKITLEINTYLLQYLEDIYKEIQSYHFSTENNKALKLPSIFSDMDCARNIVECTKLINSFIMEFLDTKYYNVSDTEGVYTRFSDYYNNLPPDDKFLKRGEVEHIDLYDISSLVDIDKNPNSLELRSGIKWDFDQLTNRCMVSLKDCKATGHLRAEMFSDVGMTALNCVPFFDLSTIKLEFELPYVELYKIIGNLGIINPPLYPRSSNPLPKSRIINFGSVQ